MIHDRHMVRFICNILTNRSFVLKTSRDQNSRLRNGVPQCSVLSPMLFNLYISDLPQTISRKYGYAHCCLIREEEADVLSGSVKVTY